MEEEKEEGRRVEKRIQEKEVGTRRGERGPKDLSLPSLCLSLCQRIPNKGKGRRVGGKEMRRKSRRMKGVEG